MNHTFRSYQLNGENNIQIIRELLINIKLNIIIVLFSHNSIKSKLDSF
jgi:hypothetical protein